MRRYLPLNLDLALLLLRLALGAILLYHGLPKILNYGATVGGFQSMHVPAPTLSAIYAIIAEVIGGILILFGVAVDLAGILVAIEMLAAITLVHWGNGFDFTKGGWEHPFSVLVMALSVALAGPGDYSVGKRRVG
jgi:putative oxidoreductase